MCLPPDVVPSLHFVGQATRGINGNSWADNQRPFVWVTPPSNHADDDGRLSWREGFYPGAPLPYGGSAKAEGEAAPSLTLEYSNRSYETSRLPNAVEVPQSKVWVPGPNSREAAAATTRPLFCSPPPFWASGMDTLQQSLPREDFVSHKSSPRTIALPIVQENRQFTEVPSPVGVWECPRSEEDRPQRSPWSEEDLIEDRIMQSHASVKRKLSGSTPYIWKTLRSPRNEKAPLSVPPVALDQEDSAVPSKDVSMSESLSDNEDQSDEEDDGRPVVNEKRRRRMLSNRASAQRSRLRRQERLDTLEVLVAELRVENLSLTRKANTAVAAAMKFEEENKGLLKRVGKLERVPLSDTISCEEYSEKTTESPPEDPTRICSPTSSKEIRHGGNCTRESSRGDETVETPKQPQQRWNKHVSSNRFDFDHSSDPVEDHSKALDRQPIPGKVECHIQETAVELNDTNHLYRAEILSLAQTSAFQGLDPFGIDLEQCNRDMDRVNLQTTFVEDIWLESLTNCLK